jgi:WD40 repeat protein
VISASALDNVYRWDVASGLPQYLVVSESDRPNFNIRQLAVTSDGQTLIYYHRTEQTIHFYDLATAAETFTLSANAHLDPAVSSDGQKIVWVDADTGNLMVWNAGSPDAPTAVSVPELEPVHESLRPPMGGLLLTPSGDQVIISGFTALDSGENEIWGAAGMVGVTGYVGASS